MRSEATRSRFASRRVRCATGALALVAIALVAPACDTDNVYATPTAPAAPAGPPPPPPAPLSASEDATPGTYERKTPHDPRSVELHGGSLTSRFVIEQEGTFRLQYESAKSGTFEYGGTYSRSGSLYLFELDMWSTAGSLLANASFGGRCLEVRWNGLAQLTDFEDGRYCR